MPSGSRFRVWPKSLKGQMLLALALALLLAQTFSALLLYRAQEQRHQDGLIHAMAFRLFADGHMPRPLPHMEEDGPPPGDFGGPGHGPVTVGRFVPQPRDVREADIEAGLRQTLAEQGIAPAAILVVSRAWADDPEERAEFDHPPNPFMKAHPHPMPDRVLVVAVQRQAGGDWLVAHARLPHPAPHLIVTLIIQTVLIYAVLVGAMALILGRVARPLAELTARVEHFSGSREAAPALMPDGPRDLRRLIVAHNAMEARILALLDEKDVMLGAIGHDLKTPLTALRVRIESVEDEAERARMAATIEDIVRTLDDILSLARVGRPSDPLEQAELAALVAAVVEEYEDMGEAVELGDTRRTVLPLRSTWLKRALRNLIGNALRYGHVARVTLDREGASGPGEGKSWAVIRIEDAGPGIPEDQVAAMMAPFVRGDPSRNSATGGTGLGLTLARAIAEQHGGTLTLANRAGGGLVALLRLPLEPGQP